MEEIKKILDEQKHICQTEFDKRSKLIDGIWYVACEDVLNAPYPKQILIDDVRLSLLEKVKEIVFGDGSTQERMVDIKELFSNEY